MIFGEKAALLELRETAPGSFTWEPIKTLWVKAESKNKTNLFSKVGIGAKTTVFTLRKIVGITLHHALQVEGQFCFLTEIATDNPIMLELTAALIAPVACIASHKENFKNELKRPIASDAVITAFPGCVTEKYLGWTQEKPMAQTELQLVLITPKVIVLEAGDVVEISGTKYIVRLEHTLDEFKNEYEIVAKKDV